MQAASSQAHAALVQAVLEEVEALTPEAAPGCAAARVMRSLMSQGREEIEKLLSDPAALHREITKLQVVSLSRTCLPCELCLHSV